MEQPERNLSTSGAHHTRKLTRTLADTLDIAIWTCPMSFAVITVSALCVEANELVNDHPWWARQRNRCRCCRYQRMARSFRR